MNDTILGYNYVCQSQMIGPMQERSLQFGKTVKMLIVSNTALLT